MSDLAGSSRTRVWWSAAMLEPIFDARLLSGPRRGAALSWQEVREWRPTDGHLWVHIDSSWPGLGDWLEREAGLAPAQCEALLAIDPRPRSTTVGEGLLAVLRGVNTNPGEDPEDMVSLRLWLDSERVISIERRQVVAVDDVLASLEQGQGPQRPGELIADLSELIVERLHSVISDLEEELEDLEERVASDDIKALRAELGTLRRKLVALRRHIGPQRDAMIALGRERATLFNAEDRSWLRESGDRLMRLVEELDEQRDRASVTQDELTTHVSEQLNERMLMLAVLSALFMPLSLITGLLGINVAGIPWATAPGAFLWVCALLVLLFPAELWLLKRFGWI